MIEHTLYLRENTAAQQHTVTAMNEMVGPHTHTIKSITLTLKAIHTSIRDTTKEIIAHQQTNHKNTDELTHQLKILNTGIATLTQQLTPTQTDPNKQNSPSHKDTIPRKEAHHPTPLVSYEDHSKPQTLSTPEQTTQPTPANITTKKPPTDKHTQSGGPK